MSKDYVIAVDRGSTNVKSVVFDVKGNEICSYSYPCQLPVSEKPGWWEQDMVEMWESAAKSIKGLFSDGMVSPDDIKGIFVTGQGNGLMPIDKNGNPSRRGILSLDSRAADIFSKWNSEGKCEKVSQVAGIPMAVGGPLPILAWLKSDAPKEFEKVDKILFSKDWIRYKLSGIICTDPTDASGAALMDISKNEYSFDNFKLLGLDDIISKLPPLYKSHEKVGEITKEASIVTGLNEGTAVLCGAHDICTYPFGIGSLDSKELVSVVGTWGFNSVPTKSTEGAIAALYHTVPGYYLACMGDGNSGGCIDIMISKICGEEIYKSKSEGISHFEYIENMIKSEKPNSILFQPFIFGSIFNPSASAGIYGLKNWHTKAQLVYSIFEGIVMGHYSYMHVLPGFSEFSSVWLIGGGAKSRVIGQLFANITGLTVKVPKTLEITARGGAMNAWVGLGYYKDHYEACIPPEVRYTYEPDPEVHKTYKKKFELFMKLNDINKDIWSELDSINK